MSGHTSESIFTVTEDAHGIYRVRFSDPAGAGYTPNAAVQSMLQLIRGNLKILGLTAAAARIGDAAATIPTGKFEDLPF